jgi:hypothetical protein
LIKRKGGIIILPRGAYILNAPLRKRERERRERERKAEWEKG